MEMFQNDQTVEPLIDEAFGIHRPTTGGAAPTLACGTSMLGFRGRQAKESISFISMTQALQCWSFAAAYLTFCNLLERSNHTAE